MSRHSLDARRLLCPLPVIRTQQKISELADGDILEVTATDPGALHDIPAWCRVHGHEVTAQGSEADEIQISILVRKPESAQR